MKDPKQHSKSGGLSYCSVLISTVAGTIGVQQCSGSCMHSYGHLSCSNKLHVQLGKTLP